MVICKIGRNLKDIVIQAIECDETCPEDCSEDQWELYGATQLGATLWSKLNFTNDVKLVLNCSRVPHITSTVQECMDDFDVTLHPNIGLLPKKCGKQSTGKKNSVT